MDFSNSVLSIRYGYATLIRRTAWLRNEIIYGGHITALVAPAMMMFVSTLLGIRIGMLPMFITYTATLIVYSFDYFRSTEEDMSTNPGRAAYFSGMADSFPYRLLVYCAVLAISLAIYADAGFAIVVASVALAGISYTMLFKKLTRYVPGFKNVYTSGVWASAAIFWVLACGHASAGMASTLLFLFLFTRFMGNVVFFDLKDVASDRAEGLKTLPILLGSERTFVLLGILNVVSFLPLAAGVRAGMLPPYALAMAAVAFFTFYYLRQARDRPHDYLSYLMADAETLMWPVILAVAGGILAL